ncbi:MAG: ATP-binding cassette domain-containing protein [Pirellulaceae bacterium]
MISRGSAKRDAIGFRANAIGYVFPDVQSAHGFTALENVRLGMTFGRGIMISRGQDVARAVGLADRMHYKPGQLSVGQQQRVAIARAMAGRPKLLLADEPTANIDPANQQIIIDLIRQNCRDEEVALLLVTHSMEVAEQFERIVNLKNSIKLLFPNLQFNPL